MNEHQLNEVLRRKAILQRNPELMDPRSKGAGSYPSAEKLNVRHCGQGKETLEKEVRAAFRVSIILRFEDDRVRDIDAAISTLFDTLVALRRFLEGYS